MSHLCYRRNQCVFYEIVVLSLKAQEHALATDWTMHTTLLSVGDAVAWSGLSIFGHGSHGQHHLMALLPAGLCMTFTFVFSVFYANHATNIYQYNYFWSTGLWVYSLTRERNFQGILISTYACMPKGLTHTFQCFVLALDSWRVLSILLTLGILLCAAME